VDLDKYSLAEILMTLSDSKKAVLFLQGPPSTFWRQLADSFEAAGATTFRINFSMADWVYWRKAGADNYRGRFSKWADFLENYINKNGITDILYYADRLPYHAVAREVAGQLGVRAYTMEFGYLRPDWLTLERGGMGALSHFPNDPASIREIARVVGPYKKRSVRYSHKFSQEAFNEVTYNLIASLVPYFYPLYKSDKYYYPLWDYLGWGPRALRKSRSEPKRLVAVDQLHSAGAPYWMLALQIQSDYQLRANSKYKHQSEMIDEVLASFASHAPEDDRLIVKLHPLDNGIERWEKVVQKMAARYGLIGRVISVSDCHLRDTIQRSRGVITINSTVGLHSLRDGTPVKVLGAAVYDIPGLTHQGSLDSFWEKPQGVDQSLCDDLVSAMAATIQVQGSFYNRLGRIAACEEITRRVLGGFVNEPGAYIVPPPRLKQAIQSGIPIHRSLEGSGVVPRDD